MCHECDGDDDENNNRMLVHFVKIGCGSIENYFRSFFIPLASEKRNPQKLIKKPFEFVRFNVNAAANSLTFVLRCVNSQMCSYICTVAMAIALPQILRHRSTCTCMSNEFESECHALHTHTHNWRNSLQCFPLSLFCVASSVETLKLTKFCCCSLSRCCHLLRVRRGISAKANKKREENGGTFRSVRET